MSLIILHKYFLNGTKPEAKIKDLLYNVYKNAIDFVSFLLLQLQGPLKSNLK